MQTDVCTLRPSRQALAATELVRSKAATRGADCTVRPPSTLVSATPKLPAVVPDRDIRRKGRVRMKAEIRTYNLPELGTPLGQYSQVTRVKANEFLFIAGMVATDASGKPVGEGDFLAQAKQVFHNIHAALRSAEADWANVVEFTTYVVHSQDVAKFMEFRRREYPAMFKSGAYPPNTLLIIDRLVRESFLLEVQTIAAL
jgi:enamine deaminase RidA (YjgF/YER057c/UK114 family)